MIENLFVSAKNCCPIEECHTSCLMIGHPTWLGWVIILGIVAILVYLIRKPRLPRWSLMIVIVLSLFLVNAESISAEYAPTEFRLAVKQLDEYELKEYLTSKLEYKFNYRIQSMRTSWKAGQADCTELNWGFAAWYFREKGYKVKKIQGMADCGGKVVLHDWILVNNKFYDVMNCKPATINGKNEVVSLKSPHTRPIS